MGEGGRSCKKTGSGKVRDEEPRASAREPERFDVQVARDKVLISFRGRLVRTLVGEDAEAVRAAIATGDDAAVQLVVARKTGNFKRGNER
jgi:hypothetical protein